MELNLSSENLEYAGILKSLTAAASDYFKLPLNLELDLAFIGMEEIKALNIKHRNISEPTDVLSFPYLDLQGGIIAISEHKQDINPATNNLMLGEILICLDIAKSQADEFNHSVTREVCYLYIHGLLHLLGFDHINSDDKSVMRQHEENILEVLNLGR